jgi:hypothetical protein
MIYDRAASSTDLVIYGYLIIHFFSFFEYIFKRYFEGIVSYGWYRKLIKIIHFQFTLDECVAIFIEELGKYYTFMLNFLKKNWGGNYVSPLFSYGLYS